MHAAWVRFISNGDPGWPGYHSATGDGMVVDSKPVVAPVFARESALTVPAKRLWDSGFAVNCWFRVL